MKIVVILLIILVIGVTFLQIFLSKKKNEWFGKILPIISFLISIITSIVILFNFMEGSSLGTVFFSIIFSFLLCNIPTLILYVIYKACGERSFRNSQVQKMSIKDL